MKPRRNSPVAQRLGQTGNLLLLLGRLLRPLDDGRRLRRWDLVFAELLAPIIIHGGPNTHIHGKPLPRMPFINSANWSDVPVVPSIGDPNVLQSQWFSQSWVKAHPA